MASDASSAPLVDLPIDEFAELAPARRSALAREAIGDLHQLVNGVEVESLRERELPARTRELALSLARALEAGPSCEQRIVTDELLRTECDRDQNVYLGRFFTRQLSNAVPDVVFQPVSGDEIARTLRWAADANVPVTLRGAATTAMGGAIPADGGLVLDLSRLDSIDVRGERVVIGAGTRMRPLHAKLETHGRALGVYPSNLGGTYAGWFATGGIGMNAYGRGRALDSLLAAELVLPSGARIRLDADGGVTDLDAGEAFDAAGWFAHQGLEPFTLADLAGSEGQFAVLVALELATEPVTELAPFLLHFTSTDDALAAVRWIDERVADGMTAPADVKLLAGAHLHHVEDVWREEDGKDWRRLPARRSTDAELPWTRIVPPSELGAPVGGSRPHGGASLFVDFLGREAGEAFARELASLAGSPVLLDADSVRFAGDRFRPQQVKRLGPGFLAAEILLPKSRVAGFLGEAATLAERAGLELDAEVYYLADDTALAIAGYLTDHRSGSFALDLMLAPGLLDLAQQRFEGRAYVLGRWQAPHFARKFDAEEKRRLRGLKRRLDPRRLLSPGVFFDMGLKGPLGGVVRGTMVPGVRLLRHVTGFLPFVVRGLRSLLAGMNGPAAGRGLAATERSLDVEVSPEAATGSAIGCVNCGECNSVCPIFHESGIRLPQMLTHVGEGIHAGEAVGESGSALLDLCMRCGNCEEVCQAGIPHLPLYGAAQAKSDAERPRDRDRHVLMLESLRSSERYVRDFLDVRPGGYEKRAQASLPGSARFLLLRAEGDAGPAASCIHCAACVDVCPTNANREYEADDPRLITTVQDSCIGCGTCVEVCPANLVNGGQTLRVMEAPTLDWFEAAREFAESGRS